MLFIPGLLTLLAIAQAGGDHIKGGAKGGSLTQQKVAQEDIIPSPFNIKPAVSPFGSKVLQQEASDPLTKTARGTALHHTLKTASTTSSKTQLSPGLHHAASSPVIQDHVTVEDPASGTVKSIKTLKTAASMRDPIARAVVQTTKTVQDPVSETKQIKTVKMIDPVKPSFSQEDKQVRDPIARPVIQTVKIAEDPVSFSTKRIKAMGSASSNTPVAQSIIQTLRTSEDPSASVVTKISKATVKTAEPSNLRSKAALKTSQKTGDMLRISNAPMSVVEAAKRKTLTTSSAANAALLSSQRGVIQTSGIGEGPVLNALSDSQMQPGSGIINELGEMILDEETLRTLQNAGGIINENGRIALNDEGIKILQNIRGGSLSTFSTGISGTGMSNVQSGAPARVSTTPLQRSQVGSIRSRVIGGSTVSSIGGSRSSGLPSSQSRSNSAAGVLSSNVLSAQGAGGATLGGSVVSGTAIFNGKEISIDGLKEGQIFDENLRPILYDTGRIEAPGTVSAQPRIRAPQSVQGGALRTSAVSGVSRTTVGTSRSSGVSPLRTAPNVRPGSPGASIASSLRASQEAGISRTTGSLTSGTALFNGKEIAIDGLKEGQLFDENLRPLTPVVPISSSGQIGEVPSRSVVPKPRVRANVQPSSALRSPAVISTSRGTISRTRTSSTVLTQSAPNLRSGPLTTTVLSGQGRTQTVGGTGGRSGGSLTSGTVLFNGKEISVDGLKEGQLFDENLRPISPGASIPSSGQISGAPLRSAAPRPSARAPQSPGLRSSTVTSTSRGSISRSRTSSTLLSQSTPNVRAGSLSSEISSGQGRTQTVGGTGGRSGGSLTSGTVLFNGKEISVDGLKEGQLFDENLRPISPGASIPSSGQISGAPLRSAAPRQSARAPQSPGLRSSTITGTSRGSVSTSRTSSTLLSQSTPNVRPGSVSAPISSGQGRSEAIGGIRSGGSLTSGTVLFNGKEISVDGLKEGQLFDENLRPISPGASIPSSGQISGAPLRSAAPGPSARAPQRAQSAGLRSSTVTSTSRGSISRSRTSSTLLSQSTPNVRAGSLSSDISSGQGRIQAVGGTRSGGSLTSGTVLFNGKEISVDGLKEGQLFDENLRPITPGASMPSSGQISGAPLRSAAPRPSSRAPQSPALRSSTVTSTSRDSVSRSRTSSTLLSQSTPDVRPGSLSAPISSGQGRSQVIGGVRSGGSLTSGTVLFNGKEISVDGLKEGQLFDENLRPISPGASIPSSGQISGAPLRSVAPRPSARAPQSPGLRSSTVTSTSRGSVSRSRTSSTLLSQSAPNVRPGSLSAPISSGQGRSQATGVIRSGGSLTSGTVLFNGKEISVDGLKEGQLFDENLRPISPGASIPSSGQISGAPLRSAAPKPSARAPQSPGLRSSTVTSTSRGSVSRSRTSSTLLSQSAPDVRPGSLSAPISSGQGRSQVIGGVRSGGSLTSGTVLFNGKEISVDGLKEGQLFDENLRPISPGASIPSSGQISGAPLRSAAPRPSARAPQRAQSPGLRSSTVTSTSRGSNIRSRTSSTLLSQSTPNIRAGPLSTPISSGQGRGQAISGIRSGGSLTSGPVLFNGKEINVDGLKEGQIFDENLQPIPAGISGTAGRSAIITRSEEISNIPFGNIAQIPESVLTQTGELRSSAISDSSRGQIGGDGSLSNAISNEAGLFRSGAVSRSDGSLTSGTALFNGQEIRIDGLREGQMFDENLKPIMPGTAGIVSEKPSAILRSGQISGIPSRSVAAPKPVSRSPQTLQTGTLRSSTITSSTGSSRSSSRGTNLLLNQVAPGVRTGSLSNTISSEAGRSQTMGGIRSGGTLTSGKVLFNGKEISIDGLKEGQMFDENLQPILPGTTGLTSQRPATISSSAQISGVPSSSAAPKPVIRGPQRLQTANLRSGTVTSSSRGTISSARRTSTLVSQPSPAIRAGQISTTTLTGQGNAQIMGGTRSRSSLTSGTVLFNGKEIKLEGLKEGQMFDENLQPITSGITGFVSEKSAILPGISPAGGISSVSALPNAMLTSQRSQAGAVRSAVTGGSSRSTFSSTRSSSAAVFGSTGNLGPAATISNVPLTSGPQASGILRSGGALTSGTVIFDGKEIPIDGLKAGQIFDENLRPITTGTSGSLSETSMNVIGSTQTSGAPSGGIPKPRVRSSQRVGGAGLRSSVSGGSSSGTFTSSRISGSQSAAGMRSGNLANTISSTGRRSQAVVGTRSQGAITSGTALFNGKEIAIDGLKEGQIFDENLRPVLSGTSGTLAGRMSTTLQSSGQISGAPSAGAAPKPRLRSQVGGSRSSVATSSVRGAVGSSRTLGSTLSQPAPSLRGGSLGTSVSSVQGISSATGAVRSASGSVLFNGKEISMEGLKPGQLYDENLRPITSGISGMVAEKSASLPGSTQISNIPSQNVAPKPRMRAPQGSRIGGLRTSVASSSSIGGASSSRTVGGDSQYAAPVLRQGMPLRTSAVRSSQAAAGMSPGGYSQYAAPVLQQGMPLRTSAVRSSQAAAGMSPGGSLTSGAVLSSGVSSAQDLTQTFGGARSGGSLTSGTVLFNGKEISIDGLKEGQLFDENLRPIGSVGGYAGGIISSDGVSNAQRSSSTRNLRTGTSSATSGLRSQTASVRGSPAASGSLNYIDVTRTDDSLESSGLSSENVLGGGRVGSAQRTSAGGAWEYASRFGSKVSQDRITPEISQYGIDTPVQESILNIPDDPFKKASSMKAPSVSRQTQIKLEDVLEQGSLTKPDILRSVQETVPFSIPESSKKIAQISQKDIDIPTAQEKLLGDFSGYLPKTSFLPPFNYDIPELAATKYSVKTPMSQVQQKMEQVFV